MKEKLLAAWNYLSPNAHVAVIFYILGMVTAWIIRLL